MLMIDFIFTFVFVFQIDWVCQKLLADPLMADGYNAIGISQGGLLVRFDMPWETQWLVVNVLKRGLVQRCPLPVKNLITFGSPHQVDLIKHLRRHNIPRSLSLIRILGTLAEKKAGKCGNFSQVGNPTPPPSPPPVWECHVFEEKKIMVYFAFF